jgi:hypothetical protein
VSFPFAKHLRFAGNFDMTQSLIVISRRMMFVDITVVFILVRALERLLIVCIGGGALWMGWQLFLRLQTEMDQTAEMSYKDLSVKLQRVGPGIFFALFGTALLGIAVYQLPSLGDPQSPGGRPSVMMLDSSNQKQLERTIVALNLTMVVQSKSKPPDLPQRDWTDFKDGELEIATLRNQLLKVRFGDKTFDAWWKNREALRSQPDSLRPELLKIIRPVDDLARKLSYE